MMADNPFGGVAESLAVMRKVYRNSSMSVLVLRRTRQQYINGTHMLNQCVIHMEWLASPP